MALPRGAVSLSACVIVVLTMLTYFLETSLNAVVHYSFAKYIYLYIFFYFTFFHWINMFLKGNPLEAKTAPKN